MIEISGLLVRFYLTPEGKRALKGVVPTGRSFEALVLESNELGSVVWKEFRKAKRIPKRKQAIFLRWDYIALMAFDYEYPVQAEMMRPTIGFRPTSSKEAD